MVLYVSPRLASSASTESVAGPSLDRWSREVLTLCREETVQYEVYLCIHGGYAEYTDESTHQRRESGCLRPTLHGRHGDGRSVGAGVGAGHALASPICGRKRALWRAQAMGCAQKTPLLILQLVGFECLLRQNQFPLVHRQ